MNTISNIINPNKYNSQWVLQIGSRVGTTTFKQFATRAECAAFAKTNGMELLTKKAFNREMNFRAHVHRVQHDTDYSFASNG